MKSHLPLLALLCSSAAARAQYTWSADFNDGLTPSGLILRGNAAIQSSGGVSGSGCLVLTPAAGGMEGDAILPQFWEPGETPAAFTIRGSVKMNGNSGGVIGDGFSISLNDGIPPFMTGEHGAGNGPKFNWDTFDNDGTDGGATMWWPDSRSHLAPAGPPNRLSSLMINRNNWYAVEFSAQTWMRASYAKFDGSQLFSRGGSADAAPVIHQDGRLIIGARTGDAFCAHLFDNLSVTVTPYPVFREQPQSVQITSGSTPAFFALTNFNVLPWQGIGTSVLAASATTEWQARRPGGEWAAIPNTAEPILWGPYAKPQLILHNVREDQPLWDGDDAALPADGTQFRCVLTWHNGYSTATQPATLRLMTTPESLPGAITLFNASPLGHAEVTWPHEEGKVLRLTPAAPDCLGAFVFDEIRRTPQNQPQHVTALTASFQYRGSLATAPRADGISFNIASDLPDSIPAGAGEEGAGTGLTIAFDAYQNDAGDPTGIDIRWRGQLIARVPVEADGLFGDDWVEAYVRIEADGTLDLALNGNAVIFDLPLSNWTGIDEPRMAFYGRTGSLWQQQDVRGLAVAVTGSPVTVPPVPGDTVPVLSVRRDSAGTIVIDWPAVGTDAWTLQKSTDLTTWVPSGYEVYVFGSRKAAIIALEEPRLYFRLARTGPGSGTTP